MKILMIIHFVPYPPHGGCLQRSFNLLRELAKEHEIHLLAFTQRALLPDEESLNESIAALNPYCSDIKVFELPSDRSRIRWYFLLLSNLLSISPYSVWKFKSKMMADEIRRQLATVRFDLIHLDTIDLAQYAGLAPGVPKILNHHNVESELLLRRSSSERNPLARLYLYLQGRKLRRYEKKHAPESDVNLVVSPNDGKQFRGFAPGARFEVVPNGTDTEYFSPRSEEESRELVFAGGMNWHPNRDAMIYFCEEIYPLIKKSVPDVAMNIIGSDPPRRVLACADEDKSIRVHGYVDDVRTHFARSAVYVVPIRVGGGTRLKILDAFASGKALVSMSVGCEGIDVTHGENILIGDTAPDFAGQVVRLLNDGELRWKLEVNARRLAEEKYAWPVIGRNLKEILQSLVK